MSKNAEFDSLVPASSFDRRSFLVTSLGAGFALAVQPVMAQTVIKTDEVGLLAGEIRVPVKDGEMVAYRAQPKTGSKAPVVLVLVSQHRPEHEGDGHHTERHLAQIPINDGGHNTHHRDGQDCGYDGQEFIAIIFGGRGAALCFNFMFKHYPTPP